VLLSNFQRKKKIRDIAHLEKREKFTFFRVPQSINPERERI
jgi:hypothetical protein